MINVLRKLRIVFSIFCGIVCLFVLILWIGSYLREHCIAGPAWSRNLIVASVQGRISIAWLTRPPMPREWTFHSRSISGSEQVAENDSVIGFQFVRNHTEGFIFVPHWSLFVIAVLLTSRP
jgi:hypothetical protein